MYVYRQYYEPKVDTAPDGTTVVTVIHYGEYRYLYEAYDFLQAFLHDKGYQAMDEADEIYVKDSHSAPLKEAFETHLKMKVKNTNKEKTQL